MLAASDIRTILYIPFEFSYFTLSHVRSAPRYNSVISKYAQNVGSKTHVLIQKGTVWWQLTCAVPLSVVTLACFLSVQNWWQCHADGWVEMASTVFVLEFVSCTIPVGLICTFMCTIFCFLHCLVCNDSFATTFAVDLRTFHHQRNAKSAFVIENLALLSNTKLQSTEH